MDFSDFKTWVKAQPKRKMYDYQETGEGNPTLRCALGQYLAEKYPGSHPRVYVGKAYVGDSKTDIPRDIERALQGALRPHRETHRRSFGGLAKRLDALETV